MKHLTARRVAPAAALTLAAALALVGCSSGNDDGDSASASSGSAGTTEMPVGVSASISDTLEVSGFWVRESSLDLSAGFGTITNTGSADDALVGASAEGIPMIELHQTVDGVMQQVPQFPVPAAGSVTLAPGGNHLMFMGLTEPLTAGEEVEVTLEFASGQTGSLVAPIEPFTPPDGQGSTDMSDSM